MSPEGKRTFIIVGAGLAGAKAAETLRAEGFDGRLLLFGEEPVRPYERPPMSKTYLRGESSFDEAAVHDTDFYRAQEIELHTSTVVASVDPAESNVQLAAGARLAFDRLLLATGAAPRRPNIPGVELEGFHLLRTVADSDAVRAAATAGSPIVVIGAGWIGSEVAASARQLGADVTMVDLVSVPLERVLGREVGAVYRDLHASHGVTLRFGVGIEAMKGAGRIEEVRLTDGTVIPAGAVVAGIGVQPRTELAAAAGLHIDNGVLTDAHLVTSAPEIYAAGDVASAWHPTYGVPIRLEHWSAALNQGPVAARNMLGIVTPYEKTPYFYSDQYDLGMEYRGWAPTYDRVVFRGDPAGGEFLAFWLRDGVVAAAMNANVWDQGDAIEALLRARSAVHPAALADPATDLASLADGNEGGGSQ
jgi:3-phenylpropionate/trans-cinnamate dioxygenase ferredoxin reductase component